MDSAAPSTEPTRNEPEVARPARIGHPLGPLVERVPCRGRWTSRGLALIVAAVCLAALGLAFYLTPNPKGVGTHRQLGFGPCGMLVMTGLPCPTCGMTTAYAETVRGRLWAAFKAQPMGMILCLGTLVAALAAVSVLLTGRTWRINWYRISPNKTVVALVGLLILSWAYKIAATLLDAPR